MGKIKKNILTPILILVFAITISIAVFSLLDIKDKSMPNYTKDYKTDYGSGRIKLPEPRYDSDTSVEEALLKRRSVRNYKNESLELFDVSQLLWAAQGITDFEKGFRTAPSAGALYPMEIYLVSGDVNNLPKGIYKYLVQEHGLIKIVEGDKREELYNIALQQSQVKDAPMILILSAIYERTTVKYGENGIKYVQMEAGHAAQNVYLQAVSLGLGTVATGAFDKEELKKLLKMPEKETPLYLMPVGRK